jgi:DNA-binding response OmpR family regulator
MELTQQDSSNAARRLAHPLLSTKSRPRILLAEDDQEMRSLVASALRADGYEVIEVADGGRLLACVGTTYMNGTSDIAYDLLVSDIRMPAYNGIDILEGLREAGWPTPVILMTGFGNRETSARAEELGATLFNKPFDIDDLRTAVRHLIPGS